MEDCYGVLEEFRKSFGARLWFASSERSSTRSLEINLGFATTVPEPQILSSTETGTDNRLHPGEVMELRLMTRRQPGAFSWRLELDVSLAVTP